MWNKKDIKKAIFANFTDDFQGKRVSIDTRTIEKGDIFLALRGENFDGHLFIQEALAKGASAIIAEKTTSVDCPNYAVVENGYSALANMAKYKREIFKGTVIAITGSVGKTTLKEMLALVLKHYGKVSFTYKNQNNNLGTLLSLANLEIDSDFAVLEVGMSKAGEIAKSVEFVKPDIAIITSVNLAHSEFFENVQGIADAKLEIINEKPKTLILNTDNDMFEYLHKKALDNGVEDKDIITVGSFVKDNVFAFGCRVLSPNEMEMGFKIDGKEIKYTMASYNKNYLILAGLCLAVLQNLQLKLKKDLFKDFKIVEGRGQVIKINHYSLIDDSYNANPFSMQEAIKNLTIFNNRKILILGEMLEIGKEAESEHLALMPIILGIKPYKVFVMGDNMCKMLNKLPQEMQGTCEKDVIKLAKDVLKYILPNDVVFVKGSFSSKVHQVVKILKNNKE